MCSVCHANKYKCHISACRSPAPSLLTPYGLWLQQMSSSVQIKILLPHWRVLLSGHGLPAMEHIRAVSSLFTLKSAYELRRQRFTITSKSFLFVPLRGSNPQPARFFYLLKTSHGQSKEVTPVICVPLCLLELSGVCRYTCTPSICFCTKRSRLDNSYQYILLP